MRTPMTRALEAGVAMATQDEMTNWKGKLAAYRSEALMVLVVIVTAIAIWMVPADKDKAPPSLPQLPAPGPEAERAPSAAAVEGAAAFRGGGRPARFGGRAGSHLAGAPRGDAA